MSEIKNRYQRGEVILASEFNSREGLRTFGSIVWPEWEEDKATAQEHLFDNDVSWQKVHPLPEEKTPKEEHLTRPTELKNGITYTLGESFDRAYEQMRISEVRRQLRNVTI